MRPVISLLALTLPSLASSSSGPDSGSQVPITQSSSDEYVCQHPPYKIQLVSSSPLVIYIKDFLTKAERDHLREVSKSTFRRSAVSHNSGSSSSHRTSKSTYLKSADDPIVQCIESRALLFQGHDVLPSQLEPLQLVRYTSQKEYYRLHTDWFDHNDAYKLAINGGNRISSFFAYVYVRNDTTGGGTNFPLINPPRDEKWCDVLDCDEPWEKGVTFRPVEGNAIYWENMYPDGSGKGDHRTVHAGLPVTSGDKIGMNIWTRQVPIGEDARAAYPSRYK
ncbi:hypothetical protein QBC37DRAFT_471391 [Rhypophila decipiens]|uniref:Fe2OG dioxygenase domain-containing protein n=1 Tax=Rhypophila decipiens TaxID=261697 RepID=A0AAN6YBZ7_9PEZI|nr:hypothetical protein QBC37DRAFT_471391 [Rhypophila decipiens]